MITRLQDKSPDTIPPVDSVPLFQMDPHIHAIPHLINHHQDHAHSADHAHTPTVLVHLEFRYCDFNHIPPASNTPYPTQYPAGHDPGAAIEINSILIELNGNVYDQIMNSNNMWHRSGQGTDEKTRRFALLIFPYTPESTPEVESIKRHFRVEIRFSLESIRNYLKAALFPVDPD